jgi:hypothetical protein
MKAPMRNLLVVLFILGSATLGLASAKKPAPPKPTKAPVAATSSALGEDSLRQLLADFQVQGADARALTDRFRPTPEDLAAVFDATTLPRVQAYYGAQWAHDPISAKPGETELQIHKATTDDLLTGTPPSREFPLGWRAAAKGVKKGLTFYSIRFAKPGTKESSLWDAFVSVNGHFVYLPKVWLAIK